MSKVIEKPEELIVKNGKPVEVILPIDTYKEMLERLEDIEDLKMLKIIRNESMKFRKFTDFLKENNSA